jgi:hypothetical protein
VSVNARAFLSRYFFDLQASCLFSFLPGSLRNRHSCLEFSFCNAPDVPRIEQQAEGQRIDVSLRRQVSAVNFISRMPVKSHVCKNVQTEFIKNSAHYIAQEQPAPVATLIEYYASL